MKKIKIITLFIYFLFITAALVLNITNTVSNELFWAVFAASTLNFINLIMALILYDKSLGKSNKSFLKYNLGGMVLRLFGLLVLILLTLKFLNIDVDGFILLFFVFYFSQLFAEIGYFLKTKDIIRNT
ncbi:MAG: hypothetical protein JW995_01075 [Melioribacteraceae bacterium]|nr:hypothetical protein [Melioribacteraceae bacterium]